MPQFKKLCCTAARYLLAQLMKNFCRKHPVPLHPQSSHNIKSCHWTSHKLIITVIWTWCECSIKCTKHPSQLRPFAFTFLELLLLFVFILLLFLSCVNLSLHLSQKIPSSNLSNHVDLFCFISVHLHFAPVLEYTGRATFYIRKKLVITFLITCNKMAV